VKLLSISLPLLLLSSASRADRAVVFNEIMYHPAANEPTLEWVELYNQMSVDVDISGWRISNGIEHTFPNGTLIRGGGYLVVAISPGTLSALTGVTNLFGPFSGRLSNSGEKLELQDINGRSMDSVNYGTDGDWPPGPDGSGVSLAKKHPNLASKAAGNWTASLQIGGTPGAANFSSAPLTGAKTNVVSITGTWRYDDSGTDLGTSWRDAAYDDSGWASGPALFFVEDALLPAPKNSPLTPGRNTYYFRTAFAFNGNVAQTLLSFRPIVDDGAVIYLNGVEIYRLNMPTGAVTYATLAASAIQNAGYSGPFSIASSNLVVGQNVLAVEVHQTTTTTNVGLRVVSASGYTASWDGSEGDFSSPSSPAFAPTNAALGALGAEIFTSSNTNLAANLNDGRYGGTSAWSPATNDANPFIVVRFNQTIPISSIAWSRDNGDTAEAACGGTCTDRSLGNYTFQYTLVTNPAIVTIGSVNPSNGWATIATAQYLSAQPGFTPYLRHRFDFVRNNGAPLLATGVRLRPTNTNTIDEIEVNPPTALNFDAVFGMELTATDVLPPPPKLALNEISGASTSAFWLAVINYGETAVDLAGVQVVRTGSGSPSYTFPAQTLAPGGIVALTQAELGFSAQDQNKLFLYGPGRFVLLDAVSVNTATRGRHPDGKGDWMFSTVPAPGASNIFVLHDEIVFNEIMYHHRAFDPIPAVTSNFTMVPLTGTWRYNDSGADLGSAWLAPGYNDAAWPSGPGLMYFNAGALPAPANTALAGGRNTYYFRASFNFSGSVSNVAFNMRTVVDDGAIFYLNGAEIYRLNMPAGVVAYGDSATTAVGDAGFAGPVTLSASNLVQGANVLAVEVHQRISPTNSSGLTLSGGGLQLVEEGPFGGFPPMNLARQPGAVPFVIDSLAGYPIHDYLHLIDGAYGNANSWIGNSGSPGFAGVRFGGVYTISSFAFGRDNLGAYSDRTLGLYTLQYTRIATPDVNTAFTGNADTGWATIGTLNYQGAGAGLFGSPSRRHRFTFTPVTASGIRLIVPGTGIGSGTCIDELEVNPPDSAGDVAFGAELVLTTTLTPAFPFTPSDEQWVELYNRATNAVDLTGWRIDEGIDYRFAPGTSIEPGGYLVVAKDPAALLVKFPGINAVGPFTNKLSQSGELIVLKDAGNNPANSVRYYDDGRWPEFADGGGPSLELIDRHADNSKGEAWASSDESARNPWRTYTYRGIAADDLGPTDYQEFHLGLLETGEVLLDDITVVESPDGAATQLIQNTDFESGASKWRIMGNHHGEVILDPDNPGNHVLHLRTTGNTDDVHNHLETTLAGGARIVNGREYQISFRAKWLAGNNLLNTRLYHHRVARTHVLAASQLNGTPGSRNSRSQVNIGPAFDKLNHTPVVPAIGQPVTVSVEANDPDGVSNLTLWWSVDSGTWQSTQMTNDPSRLTLYASTIPGQASNTVVQFYIAATDSLGVQSLFPPEGPRSRALYTVNDGQANPAVGHNFRIVLTPADAAFFYAPTNLMSNDRFPCTVVYDEQEVFYNAAVRGKGSVSGRGVDARFGYVVYFPTEHLFRGVQGNVQMDRSGGWRVGQQFGQDEIVIRHILYRAGGLPTRYDDLVRLVAPVIAHTGPTLFGLSRFENISLGEQYKNGSDGNLYEYDLIYIPNGTADGNPESWKVPNPYHHVGVDGDLGPDIRSLGDDKEQYRFHYLLKNNRDRDDFARLIDMCKVFDLTGADLDTQSQATMDVDEWLRMFAVMSLCGVGDVYSQGLNHNIAMYTRPADNRVIGFPWDWDFAFVNSTSGGLYGTSRNIAKIINLPSNKRAFYYHLRDLIGTVFNSAYMAYWTDHYDNFLPGTTVYPAQSFADILTYIGARASFVQSQFPAQAAFAITSNGGNDFLTNSTMVTITGTGWLDIQKLGLVGGTGLTVNWPTLTNWQATVPLLLGTNLLTFLGYDRANNVIATDSITVTTTASGGGVDTDGDGMPDAWESAHGLNPFVNDANLDKDGDGLSNLQEYLTGTDPNDPDSFLRVDASSDALNVRLNFFAVAGRSYSVLQRGEAGSGDWTKLTNVAARMTNRVAEVLVPKAGTTKTFYRVVAPQQ